MKKILFLFMFLPLLASAQTPSITGCLGLTLGMPQNEAIHQLASKIDTTGLTIFTRFDNETIIRVYNVHFANDFFDHIVLFFYDGKLYQIIFVNISSNESKMESVFSGLKSSYKIQ
jgi:Ni,Fe-hydrogenase I cytochrome b subunit